jgi:hypothetical protein
MRYERERAARRTVEARSKAQMGRTMGEREERGVDGARDERHTHRERERSEERAAHVGRAMGGREEQAMQGGGHGGRRP